jgi:DNA-directed RNA polymerase subunit RPC12/RpoP
MKIKCMDCLIQMNSHLSKWTALRIYECPECNIAIREIGDDE